MLIESALPGSAPGIVWPPTGPTQRSLRWALAASLLIHGLALIVPAKEAPASRPAPARIEASLAAPPSPPKSAPSSQPAPRPRLLTAEKSRGPAVAVRPKWSTAEKAEMNQFLDELASQAKARPKPTLAQHSLASAREYGRQMAQQDEAAGALLERRPNAPPPDPFSLDLYVDGLIKRLNRSATFVRNDPRSQGLHSATVQFRVNPDGTLKSFVVLNAADQGEEIAFIRAIVERSAPFSPFPPDLNKAASALAMTICINPSRSGDGGFGFSRAGDGRGC